MFPFGPVSGAKIPHDFRQNRPTAGRGLLVSRTCAPFVVVPAASGRGSLPAGIHTTGATPTERGGDCLHGCLHPCLHPPPRLTAPAVKKGGSLPSNPSPLARLGSSGLARKNRTKAGRKWMAGCLHPPHCFVYTPPSDRVNNSLPPTLPRALPRNGPDDGALPFDPTPSPPRAD